MKRTPLLRRVPIQRSKRALLTKIAAAALARNDAEVDHLVAKANGRELIRIGNLQFEIPAGVSRAKRRAFIQAAEQHALDTGEITLAEARRILRDRTESARSPTRRDPRSRRTKYARRERDLDYMGWVKRQPCATGSIFGFEFWSGSSSPGPCRGPIEAHHAGARGVGQKAPDDTCIPLCAGHHRALTDRRGPFASWPREALKRWELAMVAVYQQRYADHLAGRDAGVF